MKEEQSEITLGTLVDDLPHKGDEFNGNGHEGRTAHYIPSKNAGSRDCLAICKRGKVIEIVEGAEIDDRIHQGW